MLINLFHSFHPQPILFKFLGVNIYWYGFFIALGIILGLLIILWLAKQYGIHQDHLWQISFYLIIFGLIGARLYHVLCELPYYLQHPLDMVKFWQGGLGIFGAVIAGLIVVYFYSRQHKLLMWLLLDILVIALILGQTLGRWGNYFNQELYGLPTNLGWGIPIDPINRLDGYSNITYFQPTFFYQFLWNLIVFVILLISHLKRLGREKSFWLKQSGKIFIAYLILYPIGRFFVEILRIDIQPALGIFRLGQVSSVVMLIIGLILFWLRHRRVIHN